MIFEFFDVIFLPCSTNYVLLPYYFILALWDYKKGVENSTPFFVFLLEYKFHFHGIMVGICK